MFWLLGATTTLMGFFGTPAFADTVTFPQYCSCVSYVRQYIPSVPHVDAWVFPTFPRSAPAVGEVAMFNYSGIFHVAYISQIRGEGFEIQEANFHSCQKGTRFISWDDPHLVGFWKP